ncbi:hypothetical protein L6R53_30585, partial [Myxococcota bacterium]|nr:hypothetical protein [Myxococcota bacterium]
MSLLLAWLFASWAQEPAAPPLAAEEEVVSDPVWTAVPMDERVIDGVPLLGPWPDDWRPQVD